MNYTLSNSLVDNVSELTHVDLLVSPFNSTGGSKYALVFKDDRSKFRTVYFFKTKENTVSFSKTTFTQCKRKRVIDQNAIFKLTLLEEIIIHFSYKKRRIR